MDFTKQSYDIIILAGQSNAQGTGRGNVTEEYIPDEKIISLSPVYTIGRKIENEISKRDVIYSDEPFIFNVADERIVDGLKVGDFALPFSKKYVENGLLEEGRRILIIRAAIGATGFMHGHWGLDKPLYNKMLELTDYALSLNPENRIKALLWHQGEHEVGKQNPPKQYEKQLSLMFLAIKERYNALNLPIIAADFTHDWKTAKERKGQSAKPISATIKKVIEELGGVFINTDDLPSNNQQNKDGDITHFSRESLRVLGKRYFDAYLKILDNQGGFSL